MGKKIAANTWPFYDRMKNEWKVRVDGRVERGDLMYVLCEFCKSGLCYPFKIREKKIDNYDDHEHSFDGVLLNVMRFPEVFSIEDYKEYYSQQEMDLIEKVRERSLQMKNTKKDEN
jgi:hypothetical protein